jgi:hypothetical protein
MKSKYGDIIERLKANRAATMRTLTSEERFAKLERSRMEVALDEIRDDLIFAGFEKPTRVDILEVFLASLQDAYDQDFHADFAKGFGTW